MILVPKVKSLLFALLKGWLPELPELLGGRGLSRAPQREPDGGYPVLPPPIGNVGGAGVVE